MPLEATEVFTPNDYPVHTYVERGEKKLEELLRDALRTPKTVVSISGPSKSGKTVLTERVVGKDNLIVVSGAEIRAPEDLWSRILDWMGAPSSTTSTTTSTTGDQIGGEVSGSVQVPLIASGGGKVDYTNTTSKADATSKTSSRYGLAQVVKEIADSPFAVLIDDFHYMSRDIQAVAAQQIKTAAERGVRMLVASVPHRADDVVRSNPELRGRTMNIDTSFWDTRELAQIATLGFRKLNAMLDDQLLDYFAKEACGSPQLMQAICLRTCYSQSLRIESATSRRIAPTPDVAKDILETTALNADYSSLITDMHTGPKIRGVERKEFAFTDGTVGDVYRCILLAIAHDPPKTSLPYAELMERVQKVCLREAPVGSSMKEACKQISQFALNMYPQQRIVEFDDESGRDTLSIVDPYWLFYIRSSPKLRLLAKGRWK